MNEQKFTFSSLYVRADRVNFVFRPFRIFGRAHKENVIQISIENDFASWRTAARRLLQNEVAPDEILWTSARRNHLFENDSVSDDRKKIRTVPADFLPLAEAVACCDDWSKWALLYRLLFRIVYENRYLLRIESDTDVRAARMLEKSVARDVHKFHAFVRFRPVQFCGQEIFVAWHEPHHFTVKRAAPFFGRRFGAMLFSILTPKGCAHWDLENLTFSEGATRRFSAEPDESEDFWLTYYRAIFNPFRLKTKAMKAELPVRHWRTLPEAKLIPELIREANDLENRMKFKNKSFTDAD